MGEEVDVKVIKKTQETLGKIIKRPPLTEKLLRKPPFRFLHDIITNVIKTTGFMKDVFTPDELISDNIKDKESKIKFLQKVIDEVGSVIGDRLTVRPGKIVAGHEADKTNLLLQALAQAIQSGKGGNEKKSAVESSKSKEKKPIKEREPSRDRRKEREDAKKEADKNKSKVRSRSQDKPANRKDKSSKEVKKASSSTDEPSKSKSKLNSREKPRESHRSRKNEGEKDQNQEQTPAKAAAKMTESPAKIISSPIKENTSDHQNQESEQNGVGNSNSGEEAGQNGVVEMGAETLNRDDGGDGDTTNSRPQTVRPLTSRAVTSRPLTTRPGTSTIRKTISNNIEQENNEDASNSLIMSPSHQSVTEDVPVRPPTSFNRLRSARPASARPPPPVLKSKRAVSAEPPPNMDAQSGVVNVIVENDKDDDDDAFVTEEPTTQLDIENEPVKRPTEINEEGEHGSLVTQILESKKDLESGSELEQNKGDIDKSMLADVTRRKERDVVVREVEKMRSNIQVLTRSINPLGKMIDYLQEDVDSMQKELNTWQRENQQHSQALKRERSGLESSLEPMKVQLEDLEHAIQDQMEKIGNVKSNVLRNDEKIKKLLASTKS